MSSIKLFVSYSIIHLYIMLADILNDYEIYISEIEAKKETDEN